MKERIRNLQIQAFAECKTFEDNKIRTDEVFERFAELIVLDCINIVENLPPGYKDYRSQIEDAFRTDCVEKIEQRFGIEETKGWVCPRCGVDRTKNVCPKGYTATIEGKCPMIAVAQ